MSELGSPDAMPARGIERWVESTFRGYRFGYVLFLLLVTFVFMASGPSGAWVRIVTVGLQGLTLLAALRASEIGRRWFRMAALLVALSILAAIVSVFASSSAGTTGGFFGLSVVMVAVSPVAIANALWRRPIVDLRTVTGALCIYVLLAMLFAFVYAAIGDIGSESFFAQTAHADTADYLYFSFITLTTVGYGDFTAAQGLGRSLASLEALLGQIYLVTVVATLVTRLPRERRQPGAGSAPPADDTPSSPVTPA